MLATLRRQSSKIGHSGNATRLAAGTKRGEAATMAAAAGLPPLANDAHPRDTPVVYRRAEFIPLSFVHDVIKSNKVMALYKKHLQQSEAARATSPPEKDRGEERGGEGWRSGGAPIERRRRSGGHEQ